MITDKIIGLDFGSCEVAAATPVWDTEGKISSICNLKLNNNKDTVIAAEITYDGELFNYFKASPKHFEEQIGEKKVARKEIFKAFLKMLIENIKLYNDEIGDNDRILLLVGCPTSPEWTSETNKKIYEKLIREATGVSAVRVVAESRAAMFSALEGGKGKKISACNGAAVFDFGSSTVDFTYMKSGIDQKELSWNLGACQIEKALRRLMCNDAKKKAGQEGRSIVLKDSYAKLESVLRKAKEKYFNGELTKQTSKLIYSFEDTEGEDVDSILAISRDTMEKVLDEEIIEVDYAEGNRVRNVEGSWKELCQEFFRHAKRYLARENLPVEDIVLTGGASKMYFVQESAREIFENQTVTCSTTPHYSVSNGLIWVAVVDEMQEECVDRIKKDVLENQETNLDGVRTCIKSNIQDTIYTKVDETVTRWGAASSDKSLRDLEKDLEDVFDDSLCFTIEKMQKEIITEWNNRIRKQIEVSVHREAKSILNSTISDKLYIPESVWDRLSNNTISVNIDASSIAGSIDVQGLLRSIVQGVLIVAYTCIGTFLLPGVGTAIGFVIGTVLAACISDEDMDKPRKLKIRDKAAQKIKGDEEKEKIKSSIGLEVTKKFDEAIAQDSFEKNILEASTLAFELVTLRRFKF